MRQLQIDQDTYKNRTEEFHKQELDRLHTQYHTSSTALTNKTAQLQQQLQDLHNRQPPLTTPITRHLTQHSMPHSYITFPLLLVCKPV